MPPVQALPSPGPQTGLALRGPFRQSLLTASLLILGLGVEVARTSGAIKGTGVYGSSDEDIASDTIPATEWGAERSFSAFRQAGQSRASNSRHAR